MKKLSELLNEGLPLPEDVKKEPKFKVYCDMDGCLTDFEGRFEHYTGKTPDEYKEEKGKAAMWNVINSLGIEYWSEMPWMPNGRKLWDGLKEFNPTILTSPSMEEYSKQGKKFWCKKNLGSVEVIFGGSKDRPEEGIKSKAYYADEHSILIDDKPSNIEGFQKNGGIGILYTDDKVDQVLQMVLDLQYNQD